MWNCKHICSANATSEEYLHEQIKIIMEIERHFYAGHIQGMAYPYK